MPLVFTGQTAESLTGISIQATDSGTGMPVVVKASHEAIQDHGLPLAQEVAAAKYESGKVESDGSIFVRAVDCALFKNFTAERS